MAAMVLCKVLSISLSVRRMLDNKSSAIIHSDAFSQELMAATVLFKALSMVPSVFIHSDVFRGH